MGVEAVKRALVTLPRNEPVTAIDRICSDASDAGDSKPVTSEAGISSLVLQELFLARVFELRQFLQRFLACTRQHKVTVLHFQLLHRYGYIVPANAEKSAYANNCV
jgi:hypothetical protein